MTHTEPTFRPVPRHRILLDERHVRELARIHLTPAAVGTDKRKRPMKGAEHVLTVWLWHNYGDDKGRGPMSFRVITTLLTTKKFRFSHMCMKRLYERAQSVIMPFIAAECARVQQLEQERPETIEQPPSFIIRTERSDFVIEQEDTTSKKALEGLPQCLWPREKRHAETF